MDVPLQILKLQMEANTHIRYGRMRMVYMEHTVPYTQYTG